MHWANDIAEEDRKDKSFIFKVAINKQVSFSDAGRFQGYVSIALHLHLILLVLYRNAFRYKGIVPMSL